jgi:hypothetical protein
MFLCRFARYFNRGAASDWCNVVQMAKQENPGPVHKPESSLRLSVTLSSELHSSLERIAKRKKVSLAWVVREAAEKYVADETPLFRS